MTNRKMGKVTLEDFKIFDERAAQGLAVAQAIDEGAPIPYAVTVRTYRFDDFLAALTPGRIQLLQLSRKGQRSIAELAAAAKRDPSAVSKDIAKLADLGLVSVVVEGEPGHRGRKVVRPAAESVEIF